MRDEADPRGERRPRLARAEFHAWHLSRRVFLALLALTYLCAFASLAVQVRGLIGAEGIRPAARLLEWAQGALPSGSLGPWGRLGRFPTLFWLSASDAALVGGCVAGMVLAVVAALGFLQRAAFAALWVLYLSFTTVGDVFLAFQWDVLLCEAGLIAILYAPRGLVRARWGEPPPPLLRRLLTWLLFRVVFMSGVVKLLSGDETWRDLSALDYHYWTQPLPHAGSVLVHHALEGWHAACVAILLALELVAPPLLFFPRRVRHAAVLAITGLMLAILATGNYGFFNLLVLCLCSASLDDAALRRLLPARWRARGPAPVATGTAPVAMATAAQTPTDTARAARRSPARVAVALFAIFAFAWTSLGMARRFGLVENLPALVATLDEHLRPLRSFNNYGLFAVMTTERLEIQLEGSADGESWEPYVFRYKPGDPRNRPRAAFFHMPRLDWQMWFAALGPWQRSEWYVALLGRLLEGSRPVVGLFESNPFPAAPPRYLRSRLERSRFANPAQRGRGLWWQREAAGRFCPTFELDGNRLRPVP